MARSTSLLLISLVTVFVVDLSETTSNNYIYWKKQDITEWAKYFPSRGLREELVTMNRIVKVIDSAQYLMWDTVSRALQYQYQESENAQMMMEGTNAQGCMAGVRPGLERIVENVRKIVKCHVSAVLQFNNSMDDMSSSLRNLYKDWIKKNDSHSAVYNYALRGIDNCGKSYPNKESQNRLLSCVDTYFNKYFSSVSVNNYMYSVMNSPAMTAFINIIGQSAETVGRNVVDQGREYLRKMVQCAKLSDNFDTNTYEERMMEEFNNYLPDTKLISQFEDCQFQYRLTITAIERNMMDKYYAKRAANQMYVIEPRSLESYKAQLGSLLQSYRDAISSTAIDYPEDMECTSSAHYMLEDIISAGSESAFQCAKAIIDDTLYRFAKINDSFTHVNKDMPYFGNNYLLSCFQDGYIYAPNTISKCFTDSSPFIHNVTTIMKNIESDVQILERYRTFYSSNSLPCGSDILETANWEAKNVVFLLERCLYKRYGGSYEVTTPYPVSTEANSNTTGYY